MNLIRVDKTGISSDEYLTVSAFPNSYLLSLNFKKKLFCKARDRFVNPRKLS